MTPEPPLSPLASLALDSALDRVSRAWDNGHLNQAEVEGALFDVAVTYGINDTLVRVTDRSLCWGLMLWRYLAHVAEATEAPFQMFGGIRRWEVEPDLQVRAELRAAAEAAERAKETHFVEVVWPKVKAWWAAQPSGAEQPGDVVLEHDGLRR